MAPTLPRLMRRLLVLLAVGAAAIAASGCGGSKPALDEALGYVPKDSPFVVAIDTDTGGDQYKNLGQLVRRFPFGPLLVESLKGNLERRAGVDFDRDIKPLLGNDFVVGATNARSFAGSAGGGHFVGAIKSKDKGKLEQLTKRSGARKEGAKDGASIYRDNRGNDFAIKGGTLVVASSRAELEDALARRTDGKGLARKSFHDRLQDL